MKKLTVIIPTFNRKNALLNTLVLLKNQEAPNTNIDISIIVVADGCTDGTEEAISSQFPEITIIKGNDWWWTRSVNEGIRHVLHSLPQSNVPNTSSGQAVLLMNDDIEIKPDYLSHLLEAASNYPDTIIGSLNLTIPDHKIFFSGAWKIRWWDGKPLRYHSFLQPYDSNMKGLHPSIIMPGRGLLIPLTLFNRIGLPDEKYLPHYKADYDFVLRAAKHKIPTLISWDAIIYTDKNSTGEGATFKKQSLGHFLASLLKRRSRTNIFQNFIYYKRHYPTGGLLILPFVGILVLLRQLTQRLST